MAKTPLTGLTKGPLAIPVPDRQWPLSDQFVGIEIEIEQHSPNQVNRLLELPGHYWDAKDDGSLRNGIELVFNQPLMGAQLTTALEQFFTTVTKYEPSPRTSIHVHMNMRQETDTLEALKNLCILYFMYENAFFSLADESRKWCSYCIPFEEQLPEPVVSLLTSDKLADLSNTITRTDANTNRYYGLNLYALRRYGTLEFRHFPCVTKPEPLVKWLHLLMELKRAAISMADAGATPMDLFKTPAGVEQLAQFMPTFAETLRGLVPDEEAFRKMCLLEMYRAGAVPRHRGGMAVENSIFTKFVEKNKIPVRKAPKSKTPKKLGAETVEDLLGPLTPAQPEPLAEVENLRTDFRVPAWARARPGAPWPGPLRVDDQAVLEANRAIAAQAARMVEQATNDPEAEIRFRDWQGRIGVQTQRADNNF